MNIALNREQIEFVQSKIAAGEYQTPEQVIAVALGLLQKNQSEETLARLAELQKLIDVGTEQIQQGRVRDGEEVFENLQQRLTQEFGLAE